MWACFAWAVLRVDKDPTSNERQHTLHISLGMIAEDVKAVGAVLSSFLFKLPVVIPKFKDKKILTVPFEG